jgi:hypothetical protein
MESWLQSLHRSGLSKDSILVLVSMPYSILVIRKTVYRQPYVFNNHASKQTCSIQIFAGSYIIPSMSCE